MLSTRLRKEQMRAFRSQRWQALRFALEKKADYICELGYENVCEVYPGDRFQIDHIVPRYTHKSMDEFWDLKNLQYVCRSCHVIKSNLEMRVGRDGMGKDTAEDIGNFEKHFAGIGK